MCSFFKLNINILATHLGPRGIICKGKGGNKLILCLELWGLNYGVLSKLFPIYLFFRGKNSPSNYKLEYL